LVSIKELYYDAQPTKSQELQCFFCFDDISKADGCASYLLCKHVT